MLLICREHAVRARSLHTNGSRFKFLGHAENALGVEIAILKRGINVLT